LFAHTFVLKTYYGNDAKRYFDTEVNAFKRLRSASTYMIRFYGAFTQGDRYNILLEFADKGSLEQYFKTVKTPKSGEDIISFWESLFMLLEALLRIHEGADHSALDKSQPLQG
jgi:serine/threonine protein kinase